MMYLILSHVLLQQNKHTTTITTATISKLTVVQKGKFLGTFVKSPNDTAH